MIVNRLVVYRGNHGPTQTWLAFEPRSETNRTLIQLPRTGAAIVQIGFVDASPSNPVTPRFLNDKGDLILDGIEVDGPDVRQSYIMGHGQLVQKGIVGRITGTAIGQGEGQNLTYDLDIEAFDPFEREGVSGNTISRPSSISLEMQHGGSGPITYGATILVGV
jgi:hypothetical protein